MKAIFLLLGLQRTEASSHWSYPDRDLDEDFPNWGGICATGIRQSPIDLSISKSLKGVFDELKLDNFNDKQTGVTIVNNGHSIQLANFSNELEVEGGPLLDEYVVEQIHLHWWSEHTINKVRYPLEVHIVSRNKRYSNVTMAANFKDGLTVIAVLYHVSNERNKAIDHIIDYLEDVKDFDKLNQPVRMKQPFVVRELFPKLNGYMTYAGSLTTPSCAEAVTWIVLSETFPVTLKQTLSLALATLASADISLHNGYSFNVQQQQPQQPQLQPQQVYNGPQQPLLARLLSVMPQHQTTQLHQPLLGSINNPMQITQPSQNYLPLPQQQQQQRSPLPLQQQPLQSLPPQQQPLQSLPPQQHPLQSLPSQQPLQRLPQSPAVLPPPALPMPSNFPAADDFQIPRAAVSIVKQARRLKPRAKVPKKAIVTKNFFIHAAPEENEDEIQDELNQLAAQPRKHYNVLFVRTPAQTSKTTAVNLAKALKEEKTVVYVLSKKTSAADLQDAIQEAPQHINKPEVFFIKYRTPEEAANAQRQIQSQYDSLGGTSTITDEGLAPVTSVVGSLDVPEEEEIEEEQQLSQQAGPETQYENQYQNAINPPASGQYLPPENQY